MENFKPPKLQKADPKLKFDALDTRSHPWVWDSIRVRPSERLGFYSALKVYRIRLHTDDEGVDLGMRPRVKGDITKEERIEWYKRSRPSSEAIPDAELAKAQMEKERKGVDESGIIWYNHSDSENEKGLAKAKRQLEHILEGTSREVLELTKLVAFISSIKEELQEFLKKKKLNEFDIEIIQQTVASLKDEFKRMRTFFKYVAKETIEEMETAIDKALDREGGKAPVFWLNQIPFHLVRVITALNKRIAELPGINKFDLKRLQLLEELELRERQQDVRWARILYWCVSKINFIENDRELRVKQREKLVAIRERLTAFARKVPLITEIIGILEELKRFYKNNKTSVESLRTRINSDGYKYYGLRGNVWQAIWGIENKKFGYSISRLDDAIGLLDKRILEIEEKQIVSPGKNIKQIMQDLLVEMYRKGRGSRRKSAAEKLRKAVECYYNERKRSASVAKEVAELLMNVKGVNQKIGVAE
ncbi:MAG: hypothetical protein QW112_03840 [Candidatus Micrarchaeia archaeon]